MMCSVVFDILIFCAGLFLLVAGSDYLIQGCVKLARILRLSPLFIGIILVAFGTSLPEFSIGVIAAVKNEKAIALGNVVGSNIANIGLILGVCCLVRPLTVPKGIFRRELPFMLLAAALLYAVSADLIITRFEGLFFLAIFAAFCVVSYRGAKASPADAKEMQGFVFKKLFAGSRSKFLISAFTFFSLCVVMGGAYCMVSSGSRLARHFGISPWIIGITVFAVGTSLPELAASLSAVRKKVPSISVGNIVGSNIFNILLVVGTIACIRPITISSPSIRSFELPMLLIFSAGLWGFMRTDFSITRLEGFALLAGYVIFIVSLCI